LEWSLPQRLGLLHALYSRKLQLNVIVHLLLEHAMTDDDDDEIAYFSVR